jgi:hypothetical protein
VDDIKLDDVIDEANKDQFWAILGKSIQVYAGLEQSLCCLLAHFSDMTHDVAGVIFFRITSAPTRDAILERLLKKKHGATYLTFWHSMIKLTTALAQKRNEIVHWRAANIIDDNGFAGIALSPPNFWDMNENTPSISTADMAIGGAGGAGAAGGFFNAGSGSNATDGGDAKGRFLCDSQLGQTEEQYLHRQPGHGRNWGRGRSRLRGLRHP